MTIMEPTVDNCDKNIAVPGGGHDDSKRDKMEPIDASSSRLSALAPPATPTQSSTNQDLVNTSNQIDVISLLPQSNATDAASTSHQQQHHHPLITRTDHNRTDETSSVSSSSSSSSQEGADLLAAAASSGPDVNNRATDQRISATATPEVDNDLDTVQLSPLPSTSSGAGHQRREQQQPNQGQQWLAQVASQTQQGVRQRMSQASDQLGVSLRQMYASASSITNAAAAAAAAGGVAVGAAVVVDVPPSYHNIPGIVPYYHGRSIGPPPSYDDVINPYAPPPSYQSLFGQFREARKTSRGLLDLLRRLAIILASTLGCTLLIAFMILIPFTMIIIGAIYIDECKIEHIPAFLLVGGLVWASKNIVHCYGQCRKVERQEQSDALAAELYLNSTSSSFTTTTTGSSSPSPSASLRLPPLLASSADLQFNSCTNTATTTTIATRDCATLVTPTRTFGHANEDDDNADADEDILRGDLHLAPSSSAAVPQGHNNATIQATRGNQSHHRARHHQHRDEQHRNRYSSEQQQQQQRGLNSTSRLKSSICESLLNCVLFGWFIAGCVIVFRNYEPDFDNQASVRYCHRTVYMYTFWLITSAILSFGLFISCICCLMVSSALASRQSDIGLA